MNSHLSLMQKLTKFWRIAFRVIDEFNQLTFHVRQCREWIAVVFHSLILEFLQSPNHAAGAKRGRAGQLLRFDFPAA